jgi:hypothetical protein
MPKEYFRYQREMGMGGPHPLTEEEIALFDDDAYGIYLLIYETAEGHQLVVYVGRGIFRERLVEHMDEKDAHAFYFKFLDDEDEGFSEECRLFHQYGKRRYLDNKRHPAVPSVLDRTTRSARNWAATARLTRLDREQAARAARASGSRGARRQGTAALIARACPAWGPDGTHAWRTTWDPTRSVHGSRRHQGCGTGGAGSDRPGR